jgi:hypothetical protein
VRRPAVRSIGRAGEVDPAAATFCAFRPWMYGGYATWAEADVDVWVWCGIGFTDLTELSEFSGTCLLLRCRKSNVPVRLPARWSRPQPFGHAGLSGGRANEAALMVLGGPHGRSCLPDRLLTRESQNPPAVPRRDGRRGVYAVAGTRQTK